MAYAPSVRSCRVISTVCAAAILFLASCDGGAEQSSTARTSSSNASVTTNAANGTTTSQAGPRRTTTSQAGPRRTTTTQAKPRRTTTTQAEPRRTTTSGAGRAGSSCSTYRDTQYIPTNSWVTFERDEVRISVHRIYFKTLTVEVVSSDGLYGNDRVDPTVTLYEGLVLTSRIGFGNEYNPATGRFEPKPGQVFPLLRVYDCWTYIDGPTDVF